MSRSAPPGGVATTAAQGGDVSYSANYAVPLAVMAAAAPLSQLQVGGGQHQPAAAVASEGVRSPCAKEREHSWLALQLERENIT